VLKGEAKREAYQSMARWVADNPPFPGRAYKQWITWMYEENRLVSGGLRMRGRRVDLRRIEQNTLVVTAGPITLPPGGTLPLLDMVASGDVTHLDRPAGTSGCWPARVRVWSMGPDIAERLEERSET
jgi:polyhydroxyalkanoate synthase